MPRVATDYELETLRRCIILGPFQTAAGLEANQKLELDIVSPKSKLFQRAIRELGIWAVKNEIEVITAVPNGANRIALAVSRSLQIPLVVYKKAGGEFKFSWQEPEGLDLLGEKSRVGIVEDVRSTGSSAVKLAQLIPNVSGACAVVDRGIDVDGISSLEESLRYTSSHPESPPAHIKTEFPYDALISFPLELHSQTGAA